MPTLSEAAAGTDDEAFYQALLDHLVADLLDTESKRDVAAISNRILQCRNALTVARGGDAAPSVEGDKADELAQRRRERVAGAD